MATISKPNTFSAGATIVASEHNDNFDTIYNDYNGNITNANLSASAAIVDTKLAQLTTASKVNLSALVITSQAAGDIIYASSATALTRLAAGTSGQFLQSAGTAAPAWATAGKTLQILSTQSSGSASGTLRYVLDNNIPTGTFKGNQLFTLAFTPSTTTGNRLKIECQAQLRIESASDCVVSVHNGTAATSDAIRTAFEGDGADGQHYNMMLVHFITSSTTAATTFEMRGGASAGTTFLNVHAVTTPLFGGTVGATGMVITEYSS